MHLFSRVRLLFAIGVSGSLVLGLTGCPGLIAEPASWLVLTCRFVEKPVTTPTAKQIDAVFDGKDGLTSYFSDISYGRYIPMFERREKWLTLNYTIEADKKLGRADRINRCVEVYQKDDPSLKTERYRGVIVLRNADVDGGAAGGILADNGVNTTFLAHEMGHVLGLDHSFDMSDRKNSDWSAPGEYFDFWDIMSAMAVYAYEGEEGLAAGPDMAVSSKYLLGWVKDEELSQFTLDKLKTESPTVIKVQRYDRLTSPGGLPIAVRVVGLDNGDTLTIEYRKKVGWDRSIPNEGLLIHRVTLNGTRPVVVREGVFVKGEKYTTPEGVTVEVTEQDQSLDEASVRVSYSLSSES